MRWRWGENTKLSLDVQQVDEMQECRTTPVQQEQVLNACILLTKLEVNRYYKMKTEVGGGSSILTPRGIEEYELHSLTYIQDISLII